MTSSGRGRSGTESRGSRFPVGYHTFTPRRAQLPAQPVLELGRRRPDARAAASRRAPHRFLRRLDPRAARTRRPGAGQARPLPAAYLFRMAEFFIPADDPRKRPLRQRFIELVRREHHVGDQAHQLIPYEQGALSTYRFTPDALTGRVIVFGGFDSYIEEWFPFGLALRDHGLDVVAFDGPGQGAALEAGVPMTAEWQRPVGAVLDYFALDDVALMGFSFGGGLVMHAAAHEPRVRRVIAQDILSDFTEMLRAPARQAARCVRHARDPDPLPARQRGHRGGSTPGHARRLGDPRADARTRRREPRRAPRGDARTTDGHRLRAGRAGRAADGRSCGPLRPLSQLGDQIATLTHARSISARVHGSRTRTKPRPGRQPRSGAARDRRVAPARRLMRADPPSRRMVTSNPVIEPRQLDGEPVHQRIGHARQQRRGRDRRTTRPSFGPTPWPPSSPPPGRHAAKRSRRRAREQRRFDDDEVRLVRRLAPHIAEGLRRALLFGGMTPPSTGTRGPGVIVLDDDMAVTSMNAEAERWMAELVEPAWMDLGHGALPAAVFAAAAAMARHDTDDDAPRPTVRLRALDGHWLTLHASPLGGKTSGLTAVVLEAARPADVASIYLDVLGLTPARTRVASLVLQGRSTRQIVNELQISSHTVPGASPGRVRQARRRQSSRARRHTSRRPSLRHPPDPADNGTRSGRTRSHVGAQQPGREGVVVFDAACEAVVDGFSVSMVVGPALVLAAKGVGRPLSSATRATRSPPRCHRTRRRPAGIDDHLPPSSAAPVRPLPRRRRCL